MTERVASPIGRVVTGLLRTAWGKAHDVVPGLPVAYYYSIVVELDSAERFELKDDGLRAWHGKEKLQAVDPKEHSSDRSIRYLGEGIVDVAADEDGIVSVVLQNGLRLAVTCELGTQLHFDLPS